MPHTSLTKSKADTLGLFLRKVAASASLTICDFGTRRCRAVASRCALILSGILQVIVVMPFDNTGLHIEQYLKLGDDMRVDDEHALVATPGNCRFNVFRGRLESATQFHWLRQFRARGFRRANPFADQLGDGVLEFFV